MRENDEVKLLRSTVREFVERELTPNVDAWEEHGDFPHELFRTLGELGFFGLKFEERYGGSGPDWAGEAALTEELNRCGSAGVANALGAHKDLGCHYLHSFGSEAQKQRLLPLAIAGERIGALAITEPQAGSDVTALATRAERTSAGWTISGQKVFITNGDFADFILLAAKTDPARGHKGISLFLLERPLEGLTARRLSMLGWRTSHTCELFLDGVEVPEGALLGEENAGFGYLMRSLEWERVVMSIGAVGAAARALEDGVEYARQRQAFGKPILDNQVWRHRFAECAAELEAARALAWQALEGYAEGSPRRDLAAMAKLVATRTACRIADEVVQVHGGYGYAMEYPAQRYYRDARLGPIGGGTSEVLREIIAKARGL